jgi:hypothetical protein
MFAVRFLSGARQRLSLPCVFPVAKLLVYRARQTKWNARHTFTHGFHFVCRAFFDGRTANIYVCVRPWTDARQSLFTNGYYFTPVLTLPFAVRYTKMHGKDAKIAVSLL